MHLPATFGTCSALTEGDVGAECAQIEDGLA